MMREREQGVKDDGPKTAATTPSNPAARERFLRHILTVVGLRRWRVRADWPMRGGGIVLAGGLCCAVALCLLIFVVLLSGGSRDDVTASFVNEEPSNGYFPDYASSERFAFRVHNEGGKAASVVLVAIEDELGNPVRTFRVSDTVEIKPGKSSELYVYLSPEVHPRRMRLRVMERANVLQKTQVALKYMLEKAAGRYQGGKFWFDKLDISVSEYLISISTKAGSNETSDADRMEPHVNSSER